MTGRLPNSPIRGNRKEPAARGTRITVTHLNMEGALMRYRVLTVIAVLGVTWAVAASAAMSPVVSAKMTGGAESPKGPAGASGLAVIHLNAAKGTVCWQFSKLKGVTSPNASHIHKGGK